VAIGANDFADVVGLGGPDERLWILIVRGDTFIDSRNQFGNASEGAALQAIRREAGEEALDRVELEADVGVKWAWRRGCLSSHSVTFGGNAR